MILVLITYRSAPEGQISFAASLLEAGASLTEVCVESIVPAERN